MSSSLQSEQRIAVITGVSGAAATLGRGAAFPTIVTVGMTSTDCSSETGPVNAARAALAGAASCKVELTPCNGRFRSYVRAAAEPTAATHAPTVTAVAVLFFIALMTQSPFLLVAKDGEDSSRGARRERETRARTISSHDST
jgi:hypothetical protein